MNTNESLRRLLAGAALLGLLAWTTVASAEPYLATRAGMKCANCHVNDTGGGMRSPFGNQWARTVLAADPLDVTTEAWTGRLSTHVGIGGNLRGKASRLESDSAGVIEETGFATEEARVYLQFSPVPQRLDIYIDQNLAPGGSINRESWLRYRSADGDWYLKAGQFYLPFGWRLEDDTAFVRQVTGINMNTPDNGVEFGWDAGSWSTQLAVSNGTAGGPEVDDGKQLSLRSSHVQTSWRVGASVNSNATDAGDRNMAGIFAGLVTGPVVWLFEHDLVRDESLLAGTLEQSATLLEANWLFAQGHNLKVTGEWFDPSIDVDADERQRASIVWEYTPIPFMQLRSGVRRLEAPGAQEALDTTEIFIQWHGFY